MAKLSGLLRSSLSDPDLRVVVEAARDTRADEVPALRIEGPAALRPFLAAAFGTAADAGGAGHTVLAVTATDREAEDLARAQRHSLVRLRGQVQPVLRPRARRSRSW